MRRSWPMRFPRPVRANRLAGRRSSACLRVCDGLLGAAVGPTLGARWHVAWPALWAAVGLAVISLDVIHCRALAAAVAVSGRWTVSLRSGRCPRLPERHRCGGRDRSHQRGWQSGRVRGTVPDGMAQRLDGFVRGRVARAAGAYVLGALIALALTFDRAKPMVRSASCSDARARPHLSHDQTLAQPPVVRQPGQ